MNLRGRANALVRGLKTTSTYAEIIHVRICYDC
jgi:hypothetical protein